MDTSDPYLEIGCPHCGTVNRVPTSRLVQGPSCGRCKAALFDGQPAALTSASFDGVVGRTDLPVIVDFWAPWCPPCRAFAPTYVEAARRLEPHVRLAKVDTEAEPQLGARFGIRSIPTLVAFRDGQEIARVSGAMALNPFLQWAATAYA